MSHAAAPKDKLRAMEYFNRAVEASSFAGAAEALHVTPSAVRQLVATLERSLGATLLYRGPRGLSLTDAGERYYQTSSRFNADFHALEGRLRPNTARPRGRITVGMRPSVGTACVIPRLSRFGERFPDVEVVVRFVTAMRDLTQENLDVAVMMTWPEKRGVVVRHFLQTRHVICASAEYWKRTGVPREPADLHAQRCITLRSITGALADRWPFARGDEKRTVDVKSHLVCDDGMVAATAAGGGGGVARLADIVAAPWVASGVLVPALTDWEALEAPTVFAAYWRDGRRNRLVQLFLEFLGEIFAEIDRGRPQIDAGARSAIPDWFGRTHGRTSEFTPGKKGRQ